MASQHDRDRTYESDVSTFELTRAQEASYPLPVNLLSRDFDYTIREVPHNSKVEEPVEREAWFSRDFGRHMSLRDRMSHRMYLAVWVMLYGSDVEEAGITMPIPALLTGASSE